MTETRKDAPLPLGDTELRALICYHVYESKGMKASEVVNTFRAMYDLDLPMGKVAPILERLRKERMFSKSVGKTAETAGRYYRRHDPRSKPTWLMHRYLDDGKKLSNALLAHGAVHKAARPIERVPVEATMELPYTKETDGRRKADGE